DVEEDHLRRVDVEVEREHLACTVATEEDERARLAVRASLFGDVDRLLRGPEVDVDAIVVVLAYVSPGSVALLEERQVVGRQVPGGVGWESAQVVLGGGSPAPQTVEGSVAHQRILALLASPTLGRGEAPPRHARRQLASAPRRRKPPTKPAAMQPKKPIC